MNDFKEAYQSAMREVGEFHADAADCMDPGKHRKRMYRRFGRAAATGFSIMCVVFVCGLGTVRAAVYMKNVIRVRPYGFEGTDAAGANGAWVLDEQVETASLYPGDGGGEIPAEEPKAGAQMADEAEKSEIPVEKAATASMQAIGEATEDVTAVETEFIPVIYYESFEEFEKSEDILFPQPSEGIGGNADSILISVCAEWANVRYDMGGRTFWLERNDYTGTSGHRSSKVFPEGICNERIHTTEQGYSWTLVDSVKSREDEPEKLHAAATAGNYEIYADFEGYTEGEAEKILDSIDLSLYEQDAGEEETK